MKACSNKCSHCIAMGNVPQVVRPNYSGVDFSTVPFKDVYLGMPLVIKTYGKKHYGKSARGSVIAKHPTKRNVVTIEWMDGIVKETVEGKLEQFSKVLVL
jgi:hypothetical protein